VLTRLAYEGDDEGGDDEEEGYHHQNEEIDSNLGHLCDLKLIIAPSFNPPSQKQVSNEKRHSIV